MKRSAIEELRDEYLKEIEASGEDGYTVEVDDYVRCKDCGEIFYKYDLPVDGEGAYYYEYNGNSDYGFERSWNICTECGSTSFWNIDEITFYKDGTYDA